MSIEQDAASDGKKTLALVAVAVLIVAGAGYVGWGWMHQSAVPESQYNLNRVANNATVSAQESRQYRELLRLANQQGAQEAENDGNSFVASLSESSQHDDVPVVPRVQATPVALDTRNGTAPQDTGQQGGLNDEQKQQITNLLTQLNARWQTSDMQLASAFGSEGQDGPRLSASGLRAYRVWHRPLPNRRHRPLQADQRRARRHASTYRD